MTHTLSHFSFPNPDSLSIGRKRNNCAWFLRIEFSLLIGLSASLFHQETMQFRSMSFLLAMIHLPTIPLKCQQKSNIVCHYLSFVLAFAPRPCHNRDMQERNDLLTKTPSGKIVTENMIKIVLSTTLAKACKLTIPTVGKEVQNGGSDR